MRRLQVGKRAARGRGPPSNATQGSGRRLLEEAYNEPPLVCRDKIVILVELVLSM